MLFAASTFLVLFRHSSQEFQNQEHETGQGGKKSILSYLIHAPIIIFANFIYAANVEAFATFFPIYSVEFGIVEQLSLSYMTILGIGGTLLVIPLCWISDYFDKTLMLLGSALVVACGIVALPYVIAVPQLAFAYMFFLGGFDAMIYAMGIALLGIKYKDDELVGATTAFTIMWSCGAIFGVSSTGFIMENWGAVTFPYITSSVIFCYVILSFLMYKYKS